jgi:hypothetical protein
MSLAPAKSAPPSQMRAIVQRVRNGPFTSGAGARNSRFVLLGVAMLAIGLDVGVARITYGVVLPAFARDLQLSLTAAGLLGTLHLIGYLLGTLASPSLNAKVGALALCRASHFVFACAMLVCGLTSDITMMAAGRFVAGLAAGFGVFSIFLIVFDATRTGKAFRRGIAGLVRHRRRNRRERPRLRPPRLCRTSSVAGGRSRSCSVARTSTGESPSGTGTSTAPFPTRSSSSSCAFAERVSSSLRRNAQRSLGRYSPVAYADRSEGAHLHRLFSCAGAKQTSISGR